MASTTLPEIIVQITQAQTAALNAHDSLCELQAKFAAIDADDVFFAPLIRVRDLLVVEADAALDMLHKVNALTQTYIDLSRQAMESKE